MMPPALKAACLLALMAIGNANAAITPRVKLGGSVQAMLIQQTDYYTGTSPYSSNYFVTNGNGTWTYTYYSTPVANGNNAGQGGVAYNSINTAFYNAHNEYELYSGGASSGDYLYKYYYGLNSVFFASRNLGVAVGNCYANANPVSTVSNGYYPNIIITKDGGLSWMRVSGVPGQDASAVPGDIGATTPTLVYPVQSGGDLADVYFASSNLGWAVGDFTGIGAGYNFDLTTSLSAAPGSVPNGAMLMTTNGGTVWKYVPLYYTKSQAQTVINTGNSEEIKALYAQFVPGALIAIRSDSAGKHVYAVGTPGSSIKAATSTTDYQMDVVPTILYSGNSGASWVAQRNAPAQTVPYGAYGVAVQTGTKAFVVGGSLTGTNACPTNYASSFSSGYGGCMGTILGTTNGGFTWSLLNFPGASKQNTPLFTSVAVNGNAVWVGAVTRTDDYYPSKAVAGASGLTQVDGVSCPLLVMTDGVKFVAANTVASFPAGFVATGQTPVSSTGIHDVYGIVWDNAQRGYIYGFSFVMATSNGGLTWVYETPAEVITGANTDLQTVKNLAIVPTSY